MKRLHLVSTSYVTKGHGFEYIGNFCEKLCEDFEIVLHIPSKVEIVTPDNITLNYVSIDYSRTEADNFLKYGKLAPYIRAIVKQLYSYLYYKKIIKSNKIKKGEMVYMMDYDVIPLIFLLRKLKKTKAKMFLWIHSAKFNSKDIIYTFYKYIFKKVFQKYISKNVKGIVVNGEYIKEKIVNILRVDGKKVHVIQYPSKIKYNKILKKTARNRINIKENENVILFFGMLRRDKNIKHLIDSVSKVKNDVLLLIAGSEASVKKAEIIEWIQEYGVKNYYLDIDYISEEKMALYYSSSDLLVLTYELESGSQSGPLSLAREFELPSLVTNTGEIGYYVKSNNLGMTAEVKIEGDFAKKIDAFFDENKNVELIDSLRIAKEKYSWQSAYVNYLKLFNEKI